MMLIVLPCLLRWLQYGVHYLRGAFGHRECCGGPTERASKPSGSCSLWTCQRARGATSARRRSVTLSLARGCLAQWAPVSIADFWLSSGLLRRRGMVARLSSLLRWPRCAVHYLHSPSRLTLHSVHVGLVHGQRGWIADDAQRTELP